jgi:cephalosporin hydroxylase
MILKCKIMNKYILTGAGRVMEIVDRVRMRKGVVIDPDIGNPIDQLKANNVNVLNMLEISKRQAAVVMSYFMEEIH